LVPSPPVRARFIRLDAHQTAGAINHQPVCAATTADATRPVCKTANGGNPMLAVNTCVECVVNGDCNDPAASRCQANQCVPCTDGTDAECAGITVNGVARNVCDAGLCVQCNGRNFTACANGTNVCNGLPGDPLANTCTTTPIRTTSSCGACVGDAQCQADQLCVEQVFDSQRTGFFCFPRDAGAGCERPFSNQLTGSVSVDDVAATICGLRVTTCPAFNDAGDACTADTECGAPAISDGVCADGPPGTGTFCATPCNGSDLNCLPGADCVLFDATTVCAL
jgi:hypothetical protein